jgi:hypothetical protein
MGDRFLLILVSGLAVNGRGVNLGYRRAGWEQKERKIHHEGTKKKSHEGHEEERRQDLH